MLPEGKKLCTSFNKLTKMFIHGINVKFGLLWTIALIEKAPSLKTFGIEVLVSMLFYALCLGFCTLYFHHAHVLLDGN